TREVADGDDDVIEAHSVTIRAATKRMGRNSQGVERVGRHVRKGGISMVVTSVISTDLAIALIRAVVGLVIAAHGAQKVLGVWGGPGLEGWTQGITRM